MIRGASRLAVAELALAGKVLEAEGSPVEEIFVHAVTYIGQPTLEDAYRELWPRDPGWPPIDRVAHTDGQVAFELPGLATGSWKITVKGDDRDWVERSVCLQPGGIPDRELRLSPDALALT